MCMRINIRRAIGNGPDTFRVVTRSMEPVGTVRAFDVLRNQMFRDVAESMSQAEGNRDQTVQGIRGEDQSRVALEAV